MTTTQTNAAPAVTAHDPALDAIPATDKARIARDAEKRDLINEYAILSDREDAIKQLKEARHARLEHLIHQDGDIRVSAEAATAGVENPRNVTVADPKLVLEKIDIQTLVEYFAPTTDLVDALIAQGITPASVGLTVSADPRLVVRRPQSADAKEHRKNAIERTKAETEATIARIVARMKAGASSTPTT